MPSMFRIYSEKTADKTVDLTVNNYGVRSVFPERVFLLIGTNSANRSAVR